MENTTFELATYVIGLTQIAKMLGVPERLLPAIAVLLGALFHAVITNDFSPVNCVVGSMIGLNTTGLVNFATDKGKKILSKNSQ